ncbi:Uncharacterised protein [Trueperella pyogenes]|nr:Uncharacterised protein [Trueperella pyogenes]
MYLRYELLLIFQAGSFPVFSIIHSLQTTFSSLLFNIRVAEKCRAETKRRFSNTAFQSHLSKFSARLCGFWMDSLSWKQSWKQYASYHDRLLTFTPEGERTKWLPLGELFFMQAGRAKPSNAITGQRTQTDSIPVYGGNGIRGYTDQPSDNEDALIIGRQGALCGNVVRALAPFYATEHAFVTRAKDTMQVDQR